MALTNWSPRGTVAWMGFWLEFNLIGHKSSLFWFTFYFRPVYQIHDNQVFIFLYWAKYSDMSTNRNIPSARSPCSCLHRAGNWFNASLPINWASFWGMSVRFRGNWLAWLFFWLQGISHKPLVQDHFTGMMEWIQQADIHWLCCSLECTYVHFLGNYKRFCSSLE